MVDIIDYDEDYNRIWQIIGKLGEQRKLTDILEVGCEWGSFVGFLRQQGFNAFGIDFNDNLGKEGIKEGYLLKLNACHIGRHFGDRLFDMVFTNGVMCEGAIMETIMDQGGTLLGAQGLVDFIHKYAPANVKNILEAGFGQLKSGGFFLAHEYLDHPDDTLCFDETLASRVGYSVLSYTPKEAVLQKP